MIISKKHLNEFFKNDISIEDMSALLFQLGHENEFKDNLIDLEITPNRGDCLSLRGIARELNVFHKAELDRDKFEEEIKDLKLNFSNRALDSCPKISFLHIEIDQEPNKYLPYLDNYFKDLTINKNNFFTDISNYLSYEIGQPTHCYDFLKVGERFELENLNKELKFITLAEDEILLNGTNLVFLKDNKPINLAGVMGGLSSACSKNTTSVLIECAYFNPEDIIGKSTKYDIKSDAAYKFERGTDPSLIEYTLRRFIKVVQDHVPIKEVKIFSQDNLKSEEKFIKYDLKKIQNIIGINIEKKESDEYLKKLGFSVTANEIYIPSHRHDIYSHNDIAEEIARIIGYNSLPTKQISLPKKACENKLHLEDKIRSFFVNKGFFEVINFPFSEESNDESVFIDNPLDSNRRFFRSSITKSLISNALYNERRQQDSIKLFEISDIYSFDNQIKKVKKEKRLAVLVSGKKDMNFRDFNILMDKKYLEDIFKDLKENLKFEVYEIKRNSLQSKLKHPLYSFEIKIEELDQIFGEFSLDKLPFIKNTNYVPISEYPMIKRDLSFQVKNSKDINSLISCIEAYDNIFLRKSFMFDFFHNKKNNFFKLGFRFIFQSNEKTLTDVEIDSVIDDIVESSLIIGDINIPGYN